MEREDRAVLIVASKIQAVTAPDVPAPPPGVFSNAVVADNIVYVSGMHAG